jgi:predicted RNA-binding protein YlxR (DUF448 family)
MKAKKIPMRRCVGCMESKPKMSMLRIVADEKGDVIIDSTGKANGRGIYLCPEANCIAIARKKKAIGRNLEINLSEQQLDSLFEELLKHERKNS